VLLCCPLNARQAAFLARRRLARCTLLRAGRRRRRRRRCIGNTAPKNEPKKRYVKAAAALPTRAAELNRAHKFNRLHIPSMQH